MCDFRDLVIKGTVTSSLLSLYLGEISFQVMRTGPHGKELSSPANEQQGTKAPVNSHGSELP